MRFSQSYLFAITLCLAATSIVTALLARKRGDAFLNRPLFGSVRNARIALLSTGALFFVVGMALLLQVVRYR